MTAIETQFPAEKCRNCDRCVLAVKDKNGTVTVSCKKSSHCRRKGEKDGN